jgi:hypothetical protein
MKLLIKLENKVKLEHTGLRSTGQGCARQDGSSN